LVPSRELFDLASAIFRDLWDQRVESSGTQKKHMAAEISQFDRKVEQLVERLLSAESETVIRVYESQI
jgi:site-specific DNA recombinase